MHTTAGLMEFRERILRGPRPPHHRVDRQTRKFMVYMFAGTRGGITRLRIVMLLLGSPRNTHRLARAMGLDYKAVQHHLRIMERNNIVSRDGGGYGAPYRASAFLERNISALPDAIDRLEYKMGSRKTYI